MPEKKRIPDSVFQIKPYSRAIQNAITELHSRIEFRFLETEKNRIPFCVFKKPQSVFFMVEFFGIFKKRIPVFVRFFNFFPKTRNCFEKSRRLPYPDLILKGFSGFCPALYSVFDQKRTRNANCRKKIKPFFSAFFRIF